MSVGEFWPEKGVVSNEWVLNRRDSAPASLSGGSIAVPLGEPYWTIDVTVEVPQRSLLARNWSSFFARREGRKNTFTANRSFQSFPFAGGEPLPSIHFSFLDRPTGRVTLRDIGTYRATEGDMVGWFTAQSGYYIGETKGVRFTNSSAAGLNLAPPPFGEHPSTPAIRLIKPVGEFRLDAVPAPVERSSQRTWSFKATQVIRG